MARRRSDRRREEGGDAFAPVFSNTQALGSMTLRRTAMIAVDDGNRRVLKGMARHVFRREADGDVPSAIVFLDVVDYGLNPQAHVGLVWLGFQMCATPVERMSRPSPMFLTQRQWDLIAGQGFRFGASRTARLGLDESARLAYADSQSRVTGRQMPLEDSIEVATVKLSGLHPGFALMDRMATSRV